MVQLKNEFKYGGIFSLLDMPYIHPYSRNNNSNNKLDTYKRG